MYNLLKNLFGFPENPDETRRGDGSLREQFLHDSECERGCQNNDISGIDHFHTIEELSPDNEESDEPYCDSFSEKANKIFSSEMFSGILEAEKQMTDLMFSMQRSLDVVSDVRDFGIDMGNVQGEPPKNGNLRDYVLKRSNSQNTSGCKDLTLDPIVDGARNHMNDEHHNTDVEEYTYMPRFKGSFQSVAVNIVNNPDGSVEMIRTERDSSGKCETTRRKLF